MSQRFWLILIFLVLVAALGIISGAFLLLEFRTQQERMNGTAYTEDFTNPTIQAQIFMTQTAKAWTKTPTPNFTKTPIQTEDPAMATHRADNTRAYATQTAILAQFDATQTAATRRTPTPIN
jgi:hypothetical protein